MKIPIDSKTLNEIKYKYSIHKLIYFNESDTFGFCYYTENIIYINVFLENNKKKFLNTLFHEIGHLHCYRNGIWKNYHLNKNKLSAKDKMLIKKTGLKAERWIDNWAEKEMKKWFPNIKYSKGYYKKDTIKLYQEYLKEFLK